MSGNRQLVETYDKDKAQGSGQPPRGRGGHSGGVHEESGHDEIKQVAEEHGRAHKHIVTRHEDGGGYSSETHHESGHVHHHDHHDTLSEAHEHGAVAMGEEGDHAPMDEEQHEGARGRAANERDHSGSGGLGVDLLPGE